MNTIFEYHIVGNSSETEFMDKVKTENPDMTDRFRSLMKNKGLEYAKDKYKDFDPAVIKERTRLKRLDDKRKTKGNYEEELRIKYKDAINDIRDLIYEYSLKKIADQFKRNPRLKSFLRGWEYTNKIGNLIRNIEKFKRDYDHNYWMDIEKLVLCTSNKKDKEFSISEEDTITLEMILGKPSTEKRISYNINFDMYEHDYDTQFSTSDGLTPKGYIEWRNIKINDLSRKRENCGLSHYQLLKVLNEFSDLMKPDSIELFNKEMAMKRFDL